MIWAVDRHEDNVTNTIYLHVNTTDLWDLITSYNIMQYMSAKLGLLLSLNGLAAFAVTHTHAAAPAEQAAHQLLN